MGSRITGTIVTMVNKNTGSWITHLHITLFLFCKGDAELYQDNSLINHAYRKQSTDKQHLTRRIINIVKKI
jgi:hypothetical protein